MYYVIDNELLHYGVKGMKWGVIRSKVKTGARTLKRKARYTGRRIKNNTVSLLRHGKHAVSKTISYSKNKKLGIVASNDKKAYYTKLMENISDMSIQELNQAASRLSAENNFINAYNNRYNRNKKNGGKGKGKGKGNNGVGTRLLNTASKALEKNIKKAMDALGDTSEKKYDYVLDLGTEIVDGVLKTP